MVGVRELRQHASRYLQQVAAGESIEITDRGHPIARLVPITSDPWEDLINIGEVVKAAGPMSIDAIEPGSYPHSASRGTGVPSRRHGLSD